MPTVVIPFAGVEGKTRLHASRRARRALSLAMLGDVLSASAAVGDVRVVTADAEASELARELGAASVEDPGAGQGPAVAAALAGLEPGPTLIVNADVPCVVPDDLRALLAARLRAASRSSRRWTVRPMRSACRRPRRSPRSTARTVPRASVRTRPSSGSRPSV